MQVTCYQLARPEVFLAEEDPGLRFAQPGILLRPSSDPQGVGHF